MFSHSKLVLFLLIIILLVIIYIYTPYQKNNLSKEHFESYIHSLHAKHYVSNDLPGVPPIVDESCDPGFTGTSLENLKNNMIYAKLCYQTKANGINEETPTKFINNLHNSTEKSNINVKPNENDYTKVIRSHSDYLGCYRLFDGKDATKNEGRGNLNTTANPKVDAITGNDNLEFNTLSKIKSNNTGSKIFMSGEVRPDLEGLEMIDNTGDKPIPKSLGGPLTDEQFSKLAGKNESNSNYGDSYRIPDKYCLGRVNIEGDRVKEYLGGIDAISVYKNNTNINSELEKPPIYIRNNVLVNNRPCMDYINLECIINFKKHITCDFNMIGNLTGDAINFDTTGIDDQSIKYQRNSDIRNFYRSNTDRTKRNIILDRSGNKNHMILDYNYLHFMGSFDLRASFLNNSLKIYNDWLVGEDFTPATTAAKLGSLPGENIIISRYKSQAEMNKAKYLVKKYDADNDELNINRFYFSENYRNHLDNLKYDSTVMRGLCKEWPYLGMIGWMGDATTIEEVGSTSNNTLKARISSSNLPPDDDECTYEMVYPKARPKFNDFYIGRKIRRVESEERKRILANARDDKAGGEHDCHCEGKDGLFECKHLLCLNDSVLKNIHKYENPNPYYVSISINNTRNSLQYYTKKRDTLRLKLKPEVSETGPNNKFFYKFENGNKLINNNKFFFRTSNKIICCK